MKSNLKMIMEKIDNASYFSTEVCSAINAKIYLLQETYLLVRLSQTISFRYYILLFSSKLDYSNYYFTCLLYRCVDVIIVLHQARGLLPIVDWKCTFSRLEVL